MTQINISHRQSGKTLKAINAALGKVICDWLDTIEDAEVRHFVGDNVFVTGGSIASMLLGDEVNDYDIYFKKREAAIALINYYGRVYHNGDYPVSVVQIADNQPNPEGLLVYQGVSLPEEAPEELGDYNIKFISPNAITLNNKLQLVFRFIGDPEEIYKNYDFVHCMNHYDYYTGQTTASHEALLSLMSKQLIYRGSKYPVCSIMRLRKFLKRGWTINAGHILKMAIQISQLDLTDPHVLKDQCQGVDSLYFMRFLEELEEDPEKISDTSYLFNLLDEVFDA